MNSGVDDLHGGLIGDEMGLEKVRSDNDKDQLND